MPTIRNIDDATLLEWQRKGIIKASGPAIKQEIHDGDECDFMADVIKFAKRCGHRVFHVHDARKSEAGWPDCVFLRDRLIVAELKVGTNEPTSDQIEWLEAFKRAGIAAFVWKPKDWPTIEAILR